MMSDKKHDLQVDVSVHCDNYDIANRKPLDVIHVGITVEDETEGATRRFDASLEPGEEVAGEWGGIVNRILEPVYGLPSLVDDDWFDTSKWPYALHAQKANQVRLGTDWMDSDLWVCLRFYPTGGYQRGLFHILGRGALISLADEVLAIEPCAWFLPTYKPEDWLAHEGRFSLASFDDSERDWTRQKILRGLEVAASELTHYEKMARIYEEKTGLPIGAPAS